MFFQKKKNVGEVLQKQKFVILLPSDVWSEILRYFSRAHLCRQIYLVNRQLYNLANSRHIVPTTHVIYKMYFQTADRRRTFLNFFKSKEYNYVRFGQNYNSKTLDTQQLRKMPIPKPFVRFRKVYIYTFLGESTLKFLRDAKESFVGSSIHYFMDDILDDQDMRNQMHYLFQNVFQKPSYISVRGSWLRISDLKVLTDGLPNCSRMKLYMWCGSSKGNVRMILDWISIGKDVAQNPQRDTEKKHLILRSLPRKIILDMVLQIKDAFNDENWQFSNFVITFLDPCLEGDHKFVLNKLSTNERLSFFTNSQFGSLNGSNCDSIYQHYDPKTLDTQQLRKMPIPKPFVRFQKVYIFRLLGESTLKFLRDAKESFVGSAIHYYMFDILDNKNMRNLFQNVFLKPSYISVRGSWLRLSDLKGLTDGLLNCSRIKLLLWRPDVFNDDTIRMLLDWISSGKSVAQNPQRESGKKHLILRSLPRRIILDMVQQIKDAFNDENWLFSDFVITCLASAENYDRLEGVHGNKFTLKKFSTNERLSLFTHSQLPFEGYSGRVYRLWYRRVVNEDEDLKMAIHLQNLVMWSRLRIDLDDREFYHFDYSREFSFAL
ncbi:hypothetical protein Ddc_18344 [Ditylenchus destructor]|nr:hypothetical protein Ddc_18344 [Ditylenchus destructor]